MKQRVTQSHLSRVAHQRVRRLGILVTSQTQHGRCSDWLRENRRRRSVGLPQKRVLPFGLGVFDSLNRTISKTLADGTIDISVV